MLRVALIGCGSHSETAHARSLAHFVAQKPGDVNLAAACDVDIARAERFCREYGFSRAYSDFEEMLEREKPEAVVSVLPVEKIAEVGSVLLRRGIPCVLEKPPGQSLAEVRALAECARQTGTPHMVSMNRRYSPYLERARTWAKLAGPLRCLRGQMLRQARGENDFLWGTGVHGVDALCHIGGEVAACAVQRLAHAASTAPWFHVTLRFASGCLGTLEICPTAGVVDEVFELVGEGYLARVRTMGEPGESARCWRSGALEVEMAANPGAPLFQRDGSYEETTAFLRGVRESIPLHPTLEKVLPALEVCGLTSE